MNKLLIMCMLLLFLSCNKNSQHDRVVYENFVFNSKVVFMEMSIPAVIPAAGDMIVIDSVLVVLDMMSDTLFHFFRVPDLKYKGGHIGKGQGPNEEIMIVPHLSQIGKNEFLFRTLGNVKIARFEDCKFHIVDTIQLPAEFFNVMYIVKMNDCLFGYDGVMNKEKEFLCYDITKKDKNEFGYYPKIDRLSINEDRVNVLFSKAIINKNDGSMFAVLYDKIPLLRIFTKDGELRKEFLLKNGQNSPCISS